MNDVILLSLLHAMQGPLRAEMLGVERGLTPPAAGARLSLELPVGPVRPFLAVSAASFSRPEVDVTVRAGLVAGRDTRLLVGWMGTDLEADDHDGGPRSWGIVELTMPF
jgi:hypothetical protein